MTVSTDHMSEPLRIAVFDVCNTLFEENTTAGFVEHYCRVKRLRIRSVVVTLLRRRWSPLRFTLAVLHRVAGVDLSKRFLVRMLYGRTRSDLEQTAADYLDRLMTSRRVWPVWPLLEAELRCSRVVFASASLCVVIDQLAIRYGANALSSRLEFVKGICTGRLEFDATGRKVELLEPFLSASHGRTELFVCTDNRSDIDLLKMADEGVAVFAPGKRGLDRVGFSEKVRHVSSK